MNESTGPVLFLRVSYFAVAFFSSILIVTLTLTRPTANMDLAEELPDQLEALKLHQQSHVDILQPLQAKLNAAKTTKEKRLIIAEIQPVFAKYKAVTAKINLLEQTESNTPADASTNTATGTEDNSPADKPNDIPADDPAKKTEATDTWNDPQANDPAAGAWNDTQAKNSANKTEAAGIRNNAHSEWPADTNVDMSSKYPISDILPKKQIKRPFDHAVLRFIAGGQVYCFGHLDKPAATDSVRVLPIIKCPSTDKPYFGIRILFPRDRSRNTGISFPDIKFHTVLYRFTHPNYTIEEHTVTDETEFQDFLQHAPQHVHPKANEAMSRGKLYRLTLTYEDKRIGQDFYKIVYSSSVPKVQNIFTALDQIPGCKTLSVFMWQYDDLPANLQYLYKAHLKSDSPIDWYFHKEKEGPGT